MSSEKPAARDRRSSVERAAELLAAAQARPAAAPPAASRGPVDGAPALGAPDLPISGVEATEAESLRAPPIARGIAGRPTRNRVTIDMERLRAAGMVTSFSDHTQVAEEFRIVKRPLLLKAFAAPPDNIENGNLIMVTSSKAGEGKTFCAVSLAMSIALERDLTVLLVDADVAKPDIPNVLGIEAQKGLVDLIADDDLELSDVLIRTDLENLSILPAGRQHHLATELLASEKMDRFVRDIARRYPDRVIIFDSPPVLLSSVPSVIALHVGQVLFVVEADRTAQPSVEAALGMIASCPNISLLLNKTRPVGNSDRFGAYYGYYR